MAVSIKEFARINNVSYEAVRKQINRYSDELDGHINKINRTRYLDDYAVDFLNDKRRSNPVIVQEVSKDEELKILKEENDSLKTHLLEAQQMIIKLQEMNAKQIESEVRYSALLETFERNEGKLQEAEKTLAETKTALRNIKNDLADRESQLEDLKSERNKFQKSIFGFYRKIKL